MDAIHEKETLIPGYIFRPLEEKETVVREANKDNYLLFMNGVFEKNSFYEIRRIIHMMAISYRQVSISVEGRKSIAFLIFPDEDDELIDELDIGTQVKNRSTL